MAEKNEKKSVPRQPNGQDNKNSAVRGVLFMSILLCFAVLLLVNFNGSGGTKTNEVPISDVIKRANDPDGDIAKITVTGNNLEITLKREDKASQTSR